ncbi:diacylglycerol kinase [Streptomyces sp. NPDC049879]|uniref:diacylglycerol kinase n=1 Tax=Streptomyces sp. NPDC049879 TaxID=3365598 RepID=UPI0037932539
MLIVIDPTARRTDGESVRIAKDVLCAGASVVKVCVLDQPQAMKRVLARRGSHRVVIVGDDRTLLAALALLLRDGDGAGPGVGGGPLAMVPVGPVPLLAVARTLGVPTDPVAASRAVLRGGERRVDLLLDDAGGVVPGPLGIPSRRPRLWQRGTRPGRHRLRVEADGRVLADLDRPVAGVSVRPADGLAEVVVRPCGSQAADVRVRVRSVTVSGAAFSYRAGAVDLGPTEARTWTVRPKALRLTVPAPAAEGALSG